MADKSSAANGSAFTNARASIIETVTTPLGFYALVVLIVEMILGLVAGFGAGLDRTLTISGMLVVIIGLMLLVAYFAHHRPDALSGQRAEVKLDIAPLLAPLNREIDHLKQENTALRDTLDRLSALRLRVWMYMDCGSTVQVNEIVRQLGCDPAERKEVESIVGALLQEGMLEPDPTERPGCFRPTPEFRNRRWPRSTGAAAPPHRA
jgi:hypothetical protein